MAAYKRSVVSSVTIKGGVRRARQQLKRMGISVVNCRLEEGDARPRYTAYGNKLKTGGRLSVCKVQLTKTADHRRLTDLFMKNKIVWFQR